MPPVTVKDGLRVSVNGHALVMNTYLEFGKGVCVRALLVSHLWYIAC